MVSYLFSYYSITHLRYRLISYNQYLILQYLFRIMTDEPKAIIMIKIGCTYRELFSGYIDFIEYRYPGIYE